MAGARKEEHQVVFTELEAVAKIQSVKSSNAIEGIITSDERIAAIVNQNSAPLNHNEAEIAGYRDALNAIHLGYDNIDFREVSFEEQIGNYKAWYYEALRQSSAGWENNENSYFPFIESL